MNSLKTSQTIMAFSSSTVTIAATIVTTVTAQAAPVDYGATRVAQAKVLLRPVKMYGHVGKPLTQLPPTLNTLLNAPLSVVSTEQLRKYLHKRGISSALLGGPLQSLTETRYFVIHDTSSPYLRNKPFPEDIDSASWNGNQPQLKLGQRKKNGHVFLSRTGHSVTAVDFSGKVTGTKYSGAHKSEKRRFVHIEMVQPRRRDPKGGALNDAIAPQPGFTPNQLNRLALLYITASTRRGQWLIPAFHCAIDQGFHDAHDDPQNFSLTQWDQQLGVLLQAIKAA